MIKILLFVVFVSAATANPHFHGKAPRIELNDGNSMPTLGLGTSVKGGVKGNEVQLAVEVAIDAGYRLIDTAQLYKSEDQVGRAVKNKILDGTVRREDLFILTKLWNDKHAKHLVVPALQESLKQLDLPYVDLFLIHWPVEDFPNNTFGETDYLDTWEGMEECKRLGLAKSIGVSNFNVEQLERLLAHAKVRPAANEIEVNPNLTQKKLTKYCKDRGIVIIAYAPLGSIPASKNNKDSPAPHLDDPLLTEIAEKYNKNTVQVVLRYLIDRGLVPIPKSTTPARIEQNIDLFDFCLTPQDIQLIDKFNKDYRTIDIPEWRSHKYYPF
ncbi:aldo-keto reductase AKR2E4-like isoform X2 [Arctopsyche grandis]|uniref:aldo-keto reductase AKR2E4-like isoform X2 n=1 Tax=Arctopsyche grandis TaxID=121162 RepID=UPI00406D89F2